MNKRYQVFVSSTFADLRDERQAIIRTLMEMDCIPAGMEMFPAADEEQFQFIKRVIDDCDYYVVVIGNRYGSLTAEGVSYTEKEYDYAVTKGLKVIALVHGDPGTIAIAKSDVSAELQAKLTSFRDKVKTGRLVRMWTDATQLPGLVALAMLNAMKLYPAIGWVRADTAASTDILSEINELRKRNADLETALAASTLQPEMPDLAGLDEQFELTGSHTVSSHNYPWKRLLSWRQIFALVSPYVIAAPNDTRMKEDFKNAIYQVAPHPNAYSIEMDDQCYLTARLQLVALGLVEVDRQKTTDGGVALFWNLTARGRALMFESRAVRSRAPKA